MVRTRGLACALGTCLSLAAALTLAVTPAAASIQEAVTDTGALTLASAAPAGTLSCTGGTLTGLSGSGAGLFVDFAGLFFPGVLSATGENCVDATGTTGTLQIQLSGSNVDPSLTDFDLQCPSLTGSYTVLAGIVVTTLQGTCTVHGSPMHPSSLTTVGLLPSGSDPGVLSMAFDTVQP